MTLPMLSGTDLIGYIGALCGTGAYLPQVFQALRTRHTRDVSLGMVLLLLGANLAWLTFGLLAHQTPVAIANAVATALSLVLLALKIKHG